METLALSFLLGDVGAVPPPGLTDLRTAPAPVFEVQGELHRISGVKIDRWRGGNFLKKIQFNHPRGGNCVYGALLPGSVEVFCDGRRLIVNRDYVVDYPWGKIGIGPEPSIEVGATVTVHYRYRHRRLDSLVHDPDGKARIMQGKPDLSVPCPPALPDGCKLIANLFVDFDCDGTNPDVYPISPPQAQPQTTRGRIPKTLAKLRNGQQVTIVCWGDSVTNGGNATEGNCFVDVFRRRLKKAFPKADITVVRMAAGGSNSLNWLYPDRHKHRGRSDICTWSKIVAEKPDLITLEFVNDAGLKGQSFQRVYGDILRRARALGAELILITPHFTMPSMMGLTSVRSAKETRQYVQELKDFATQHRLGLADASARWENLASEGLPYTTLLKNSINHPDDRGHRIFAEELMINFE